MRRLRAPDGCAWDREQTSASIAPYTIEEAYEVADAIDRGVPREIKDELGDLLFQVVFLAQIAEEAGQFDFDAVAGAICDKLLRRHPHVFGGAAPVDAATQSIVWEHIKAQERRAAASTAVPSALDGVARTLPALSRAFKLSKRAARVGFDFAEAAHSADKVAEELAEVRNASSPENLVEEIGDLLFAAANLARKHEVDAEAALRAANVKFERRFRGMENLCAVRNVDFASLDLAAQEALWREVKRGE